MKKNSRLFYILGILLIGLLLLAACGPAEPAVEDSGTTEETGDTATEDMDMSEEEMEPVTLRFYEWAAEPQNSLHKKIIDDFMAEYPWITVEIQAVPFGEYYQTLAAQTSAGNLPDVIAADLPNITSYAYNGLIIPLVPYAYTEADVQTEIDDFLPSFVEQATYDGQLYAVSTKNSAVAMYYNADMFAEAGIEAPTTLEEGWTMEEAREVWLQLTQRPSEDAAPTVWGLLGRNGGLFGLGSYHGVGLIRSAGEPGSPTYMGMSADGFSIDGYMNTTEAIAALQFLQDLHQVDKVAPLEVIQNGFETGQGATYEFPEQLISVLNNQYPDLNYGVMPLPYFKTGFTHDGAYAYTISRDSANPEAAGLLINWLANYENSLYISREGQSLGVRKSVLEAVTDYDELPKKIFYDELVEWGEGRQNSVAYSEYVEIVNAGIRDILLGAPVEQTVAQMVSDFEAAAAAYRP